MIHALREHCTGRQVFVRDASIIPIKSPALTTAVHRATPYKLIITAHMMCVRHPWLPLLFSHAFDLVAIFARRDFCTLTPAMTWILLGTIDTLWVRRRGRVPYPSAGTCTLFSSVNLQGIFRSGHNAISYITSDVVCSCNDHFPILSDRFSALAQVTRNYVGGAADNVMIQDVEYVVLILYERAVNC